MWPTATMPTTLWRAHSGSSPYPGMSPPLTCCGRSPDDPAAESGAKDSSASWSREVEGSGPKHPGRLSRRRATWSGPCGDKPRADWAGVELSNSHRPRTWPSNVVQSCASFRCPRGATGDWAELRRKSKRKTRKRRDGEWAPRMKWRRRVNVAGVCDRFGLRGLTVKLGCSVFCPRIQGEKLLQCKCPEVMGCKVRPCVSAIVACLVAGQPVDVFSAHAKVLPSSRSQHGPQERFRPSKCREESHS